MSLSSRLAHCVHFSTNTHVTMIKGDCLALCACIHEAIVPSKAPAGLSAPSHTLAKISNPSSMLLDIDCVLCSWTGNLVTNSSWEDFWLNEGWTVRDAFLLQAACHIHSFALCSTLQHTALVRKRRMAIAQYVIVLKVAVA